MSNALYHCKKAELHLPDGKAIPAKVSIGPIGGLIVAAAEKPAYQLGTPIEISFFDPIMGVVTCMCSLTAPLVDEDRTEYSYRCEILQQLSQDQRREDIKVPLAATVTIKLEGVPAQRPRPPCATSARAGCTSSPPWGRRWAAGCPSCSMGRGALCPSRPRSCGWSR